MCSPFYKFVCELTLDFEGMEQSVMAIDFKERILRLRGEYVILDKDIALFIWCDHRCIESGRKEK